MIKPMFKIEGARRITFVLSIFFVRGKLHGLTGQALPGMNRKSSRNSKSNRDRNRKSNKSSKSGGGK